MNILHLLSQKGLTGAEVYATTLISEQVKAGHTVYQISNGFFKPSLARQISLPVETATFSEFWTSVFFLRDFLKKNNIQVIHTHSRAAAKLAYYARLRLKVGMVSTIHGRQHISFSKKWFNQYGDFIIPVCQKISEQLTKEFKYNPRRIKSIPNPIDHTKFTFKEPKKPGSLLKIAVVGRTSGPKQFRTELFIRKFSEILEQKNLQYEFTLVGGEVRRINTKISVNEEDHPEMTSEVLQKFDLICGSGRVCMEALMSGVPCIAFGESQYVGLVNENNFSDAVTSNFGDIGKNFNLPVFNATQAYKDISLWLDHSINYSALAAMAQKTYSLPVISRKIERVYESAYFLVHYGLWIPTLMYHKIPDQDLNSKHKIYVNKDNFEKHLQFFQESGFTTLTFNDLSLFRKGLKEWSLFPRRPLILTFDDGYEDNLRNADALLKKYDMKAQIFLLADPQVDSNKWDYKDELHEKHPIVAAADRQNWKQSNFVIGSHGLSHQRLPQMSTEEKMFELSESKKRLEAEFSVPVISFAYTYGDTNSECAECAELAGYEYGLNTDTGGLLMEEDPYSIFRVNIFPDEDTTSLWKKTRWWYRQYYFFKRRK